MLRLLKNIPRSRDVKLSKYHTDRAVCYAEVMLLGICYYIPITEKVKRFFKIKKEKSKFTFTNWDTEQIVNDFCMDIISCVYLQVRDTAVGEATQSVMQEVHEKMDAVMGEQVARRITEKTKAIVYKKVK